MFDSRLYVEDLYSIANFLSPNPLDPDYELKKHYVYLLNKMAGSMRTDDYIYIKDTCFWRIDSQTLY